MYKKRKELHYLVCFSDVGGGRRELVSQGQTTILFQHGVYCVLEKKNCSLALQD